MKKNLYLAVFFITILSANAQEKYWIFFRDKDLNVPAPISEKTKTNRQIVGLPLVQFSDFSLKKQYLNYLQTIDIHAINQSKWLNAVSANLTKKQIEKLQNLPFVQSIRPIDGNWFITKTRNSPQEVWHTDFVMNQVGLESFLNEGLTAKGITVGVIDAGFYRANASGMLSHVFEQKKILGIHDYVNPTKVNYYQEAESYSDGHGTEVLAAITGRDEVNKIQIGMATDANFYLARTDNGKREFRGEEDNWVAAMEWMDSLGVRIINTSLGYTKGFTNPTENYQPSEMDGKTSVIARAAQIATTEKGILLIVAAGNEGDDRDWRVVATPADAEGVLSVGATTEDKLKVGYSSIGPETLPYTKPDVACFSMTGTSLAAPVITGFAACLLQAQPCLSNFELIDLIKKSSHLYPFCNNYIGYGVPNAAKALAILKNNSVLPNAELIEIPVNQSRITLVISDDSTKNLSIVSLFYKKDETHVVKQDLIKTRYKIITLNRNTAYPRMTVASDNYIYELHWQ